MQTLDELCALPFNVSDLLLIFDVWHSHGVPEPCDQQTLWSANADLYIMLHKHQP